MCTETAGYAASRPGHGFGLVVPRPVENSGARSVDPATLDYVDDVFNPAQPFLRHAALPHLSRWHLDGPRFHRLFGTVRLGVECPLTPAVVAKAALLLLPPGGVASRHTAARIWGAVVPQSPDVHISVIGAGLRRSRPGLRMHVLRSPERRVRYGVSVTSPEQTFCDLAADLDLVDLVILGDSLLGAGHSSPEALCAAAAQLTGRYCRIARRAAALVRRGVASPMETRLRLMIVFAGLPEPQIDWRICDDDGTVIYRIDLSYPDVRVAIEYDGRQHADNPEQWGGDLKRREAFDRNGWRFIVVRSVDVWVKPWATILRIVEALQSQGVKADVTMPTETFRQHFPGRMDSDAIQRM